MPTSAGIASAEFQTASPQERPARNTMPRPGETRSADVSSALRARASSPTSSGKPVTSGIRKFGGGPVAVMSAM